MAFGQRKSPMFEPLHGVIFCQFDDLFDNTFVCGGYLGAEYIPHTSLARRSESQISETRDSVCQAP